MMRLELDRHGGCEVDTQGEAFFAAFPRASDAVAAAADVQRAFVAHPFPVRIGVHTGEAEPARDGDYYGPGGQSRRPGCGGPATAGRSCCRRPLGRA